MTLLLAPFCPLLTERLYQELYSRSVTMTRCTSRIGRVPTLERRDEDLEASMAVARRLTSLGRAARAEAGVKVRQPLARALVFLPTNSPHPPTGVVEEELNVDHLEYGQELAEVLSFELVPNFRSVGPRLGEAVKELRGALSALDAGEAGERSGGG